MSDPQRIASLLASATEILYGLGLGDRVVAVSHECDFPAEVTRKPRVTRSNIDDRRASRAIDEEVREKVAAGSPLYEIEEARLAELAADLIVTQAQCDVCAVRYEDVLEAVQRNERLRGCQVVAVNPTSLKDIFVDIVRVGRAAGALGAAYAYNKQLGARMETVRQVAAEIPAAQRPRVALIEWIEPLMLSGNWMPELVETASGHHALTTAGEHSPQVDWRAMRAYDPHLILIVPCGFGLKRTIGEAQALPALPGWAELRAVRDGRVFAVDGNAYFNRAGPRIIDSLEIMAHLMHPERFGVPGCVANPNDVWCRLETVGAKLVPAD